jgi:hypothetical protein
VLTIRARQLVRLPREPLLVLEQDPARRLAIGNQTVVQHEVGPGDSQRLRVNHLFSNPALCEQALGLLPLLGISVELVSRIPGGILGVVIAERGENDRQRINAGVFQQFGPVSLVAVTFPYLVGDIFTSAWSLIVLGINMRSTAALTKRNTQRVI